MAHQIGKKLTENLEKVIVNDEGDYILLDPSDSSFSQRFLDLIRWVDEKEKEYNALAEEKKKQYEGRQIITEDEDGNYTYDLEQLTDLVEIQLNIYRDCEAHVNKLFGQDTLKKYLKVCYECNPSYVPDPECISDFLEEIVPIVNQVYGSRVERIKNKYNKNRKGKNTDKVVPITND